jgi:spore coat protein A
LRDNNENNLINNGILPKGSYEKELFIQDYQFTGDGQFLYPSGSDNLVTPNSNTHSEVLGNFILVNGMAWPKLEVEPRKYRLRLVNGSDSRFYELQFDDSNEKFYQIATEQGFLDTPVAHSQLVLAPGERADVIVDFTGDFGAEFILKNFGPEANSSTTGQVIKIIVNQSLSNIANATVDTISLCGLDIEIPPTHASRLRRETRSAALAPLKKGG